MSDPMDVSLDDIILAQKRSKARHNGGGGSGGGRAPRQQVSRARRNGKSNDDNTRAKPYSRGNADGDWSHDMFDGERAAGGIGGGNATRGARRAAGANGDDDAPATLKVENLHWNVSEQDLEELMGAHGRVKSVKLEYDNAGRSLGSCLVRFESRKAAQAAADAYDGRALDGMKMTAKVLEPRGGGRSGGGGGGRLAARLGPKPGQSVLERLGKKLEDRLGPKVPASAESRAFSGMAGIGGGAVAGGGHRGPRQPRGKPTSEDLDAQMERYMATGGAPEAQMDLDSPAAAAAGVPRAAPVDWDKPAASTAARGIITYDDIAQPQ
ncbi:hypothetical protein HDU86_005581 [Geranomyces michiganensis]|nr:hypothetical protein HDU86_005581 [Geranomyces michiganensis]